MMTEADRKLLVRDITTALIDSAKATSVTFGDILTEEEVSYVRLAIQREAQSIKLRQAIIEKTLAGLAWSAVIFLGTVIVEYLKNHGWK